MAAKETPAIVKASTDTSIGGGGVTPVDYVTSKGNGWRKYKSGRIEQWGYFAMSGTSETTRSHRVNFPIAFKSASGFYIFFSAYVNGSLMTAAPYEGDAAGNADKSTTHTTCTCQCVSSAKWGLNIEWFAFED